jgi:hypothetical protein
MTSYMVRNSEYHKQNLISDSIIVISSSGNFTGPDKGTEVSPGVKPWQPSEPLLALPSGGPEADFANFPGRPSG